MLHQVILCASHIKKTVTVSDVRKKVLRLPGRGSIPDERAAALVQPLLRLINESVAMDGRMAGAYKAMVADLKTCLQAQVGCMDLRLKQEEAVHRMESHASNNKKRLHAQDGVARLAYTHSHWRCPPLLSYTPAERPATGIYRGNCVGAKAFAVVPREVPRAEGHHDRARGRACCCRGRAC